MKITVTATISVLVLTGICASISCSRDQSTTTVQQNTTRNEKKVVAKPLVDDRKDDPLPTAGVRFPPSWPPVFSMQKFDLELSSSRRDVEVFTENWAFFGARLDYQEGAEHQIVTLPLRFTYPQVTLLGDSPQRDWSHVLLRQVRFGMGFNLRVETRDGRKFIFSSPAMVLNRVVNRVGLSIEIESEDGVPSLTFPGWASIRPVGHETIQESFLDCCYGALLVAR